MGDWGPLETATYGETFIAPSLSSVALNRFTFFLEDESGSGDTVAFQADVYAWDPVNNVATGSALFSENLSLTSTGGLQAIAVNTGAVLLSSGADYVAVFTTSDPISLAANASSQVPFLWSAVDAPQPNDGGGTAVYYNNDVVSQLTDGSPWDGGTGTELSLAWQATFNEVPEPSTLALVGLGAVAVLFRRKTAQK